MKTKITNYLFPFIVSLCMVLNLSAQTGETCGAAIPITTSGTISSDGPATGNGASTNIGAVNSDWYSFTPLSDGTVDILACQSSSDTRLWFYDGTCGSLNLLADDDDGCSGTLAAQLTAISVTNGNTYFIEWSDNFSTAAFDFSFNFTPANACIAPSNFHAGQAATNSMILNWTANNNEVLWEIEYGPKDFTLGGGTQLSIFSNPYTLSGLNVGIGYDIYIRAICNSAEKSPWKALDSPVDSNKTICPNEVNIVGQNYIENFDGYVTNNIDITGCVNYYVTLDGCWANSFSDDSDWIPRSAPTATPNTGPDKDHTDNGGNFLYIEATNCNSSNNSNAFVTPPSFLVDQNERLGIEFWYHANAATTASVVETYAYNSSVFLPPTLVGTTTTSPSPNWRVIGYDLTEFIQQGSLQLDFNGVIAGDDADLAIDDVRFTTCMPPLASELSYTALTQDSVEISWNTSGNIRWNVEFVEVGNELGTGLSKEIFSNPTNTNLDINNLSSGTAYALYMKRFCVNGDSSPWIAVDTFLTACSPFVSNTFNDYEITFEDNNITNCLESLNTGIANWSIVDGGAPYDEIGTFTTVDGDSARLFSQKLDLSNYNKGGELRIKYNMIVDPDDGQDLLNIYYRLVDADLSSTTNTYLAEKLIFSVNSDNNTPTLQSIGGISIPATDSLIQIIVEGVGGGGNGILIDDISIQEGSSCVQPSDLQITNVFFNSATLKWQSWNNESEWQFEYGASGFDPNTGTTLTSNSDVFTINGLTSNTAFDYYVRSICNTGDTSSWAGPFTFYTPCITPTSLPWSTGFDDLQADGTIDFPNCMTEIGDFEIRPYDLNNIEPIPSRRGSEGFATVTGNTDNRLSLLITPQFQIDSGLHRLTFWYRSNGIKADVIQVYQGDNPLPNEYLGEITNADNNGYKEFRKYFSATQPEDLFFSIFVFSTDTAFQLAIEDMSIEKVLQPDTLQVISLATGFDPSKDSLALLNIKYNPDISIPTTSTIEVEYGAPGFKIGDGIRKTITLTTPSNEVNDTISGLIPYASYHFYVRQLSSTDSSNWRWHPYCHCDNIAAPPVNTFLVNRTDDPNPYTGTSSFREAIQSSDENIIFCADLEPVTKGNLGLFSINGDKTITGTRYGTYITRITETNAAQRLLEVSQDFDFSFSDIQFENSTGGGIGFNANNGNGNASFKNCYFKENNATPNIDNNTFGGAIEFADLDTVSIDSCVFLSNESLSGGAIYSISTELLTISNSTFQDGASSEGGALTLVETTTVLENNTFSSNIGEEGGAIFLNNDQVNLNLIPTTKFTSCQFIKNTASKSGGAIYFEKNNIANLIDCLFDANAISDGSANDLNGGAIYASVGNNIIFRNSTLQRNTASNFGGAIYTGFGNDFSLYNTTIINNDAGGTDDVGVFASNDNAGLSGDAIFIDQSNNTVTLDSCVIGQHAEAIQVTPGNILITKNKTLFENNSTGIFLKSALNDSSFIAIDQTIFKNNSRFSIQKIVSDDLADDLGKYDRDTTTIINIFNSTFSLDTINNRFPLEDKFFGGSFSSVAYGLSIEGVKSLSINNCKFTDFNFTAVKGANVNAHISQSTFRDNECPLDIFGANAIDGLLINGTNFRKNQQGIKIDTMTNEIVIINSTLDSTLLNHRALTANNIHGLTLIASEVTNNTKAGGIFIDSLYGHLNIINSTFDNNSDSIGGGALRVVLGDTVVINNSAFTSNSSHRSGGALSLGSINTLTIVKSIWQNNTADSLGGGLYINKTDLSVKIDSSTLTNNVAKYGGGLYLNEILSGGFRVVHSVLTNNIATVEGGGIYFNTNVNGRFLLKSTHLFQNIALNNGGGLFLNNTDSINIINSIISKNAASNGGGIYTALSNTGHLRIVSSRLAGNEAQMQGGALYNHFDSTAIVNSLLIGNKASNGGAVYNSPTDHLTLLNTTVTGNLANSGGAIFNDQDFLTVRNSIIYNNNNDNIANTANLSIDHSLVDIPNLSTYGLNNINADPQFLEPVIPSFAPIDSGNYVLKGCSPAINGGTNFNINIDIDTTLDGQSRINRVIDMGPYEFDIREITSIDTIFCPSDSTAIIADTTLYGEIFKWYQNNLVTSGINNNIMAQNPGVYSFTLVCANGTEGVVMDSIILTEFTLPKVPELIHPDGTEICGNSLPIISEAVETSEYTWFQDGLALTDTTLTIYVNAAGDYLLQVKDSIGCKNISNTITITLPDSLISPTVTLPYQEDFEVNDGGWQTEENDFLNLSNWSRTQPNGNVIQSAASGDYVFMTDYNNNPNVSPNEDIYLLSPCFDFTATKYPMMIFDIHSDNNEQVDGATLQYNSSLDTGWTTLGDTSANGINWYSGLDINSILDIELGAGWTGKGKGWQETRHSIYQLNGLPDVRFRLLYSGAHDDDEDGFAFDNIWIGERNRKAVMENFIDPSDHFELAYINNLKTAYPNHLFPINYLLSGDNYTNHKAQIDAQMTTYNVIPTINTEPYTVFGGNIVSDKLMKNPNAFTPSVLQTDVARRLLSHASFEIELEEDIINNEPKLFVTVNFSDSTLLRISSTEHQAIQDAFNAGDLRIITVVIEDSIQVGNTTINSVFRQLLTPDISNVLNTSTLDTKVSFNNTIANFSTASNLYRVAFIQNAITKEVYQVAITRPELMVNTAPIVQKIAAFKVYPNPTSEYLNVQFTEVLTTPTYWQLVDLNGRRLQNGIFEKGLQTATLNTSSMVNGMYFLMMTDKKGKVGQEKVLIIRE